MSLFYFFEKKRKKKTHGSFLDCKPCMYVKFFFYIVGTKDECNALYMRFCFCSECTNAQQPSPIPYPPLDDFYMFTWRGKMRGGATGQSIPVPLASTGLSCRNRLSGLVRHGLAVRPSPSPPPPPPLRREILVVVLNPLTGYQVARH